MNTDTLENKQPIGHLSDWLLMDQERFEWLIKQLPNLRRAFQAVPEEMKLMPQTKEATNRMAFKAGESITHNEALREFFVEYHRTISKEAYEEYSLDVLKKQCAELKNENDALKLQNEALKKALDVEKESRRSSDYFWRSVRPCFDEWPKDLKVTSSSKDDRFFTSMAEQLFGTNP